jgi:hypothetical protein
MEANIAVWNSHVWNDRQIEIEPGFPLIQHTCRPCGRNFVDERFTDARYAVHVGVARFDRLSDATTAHWLADICPGEHLIADDLDLKTRFTTTALPTFPIQPAAVPLRVICRPVRFAQRKVMRGAGSSISG